MANMRFSGEGRQSLHIQLMLILRISCVQLDHTLHCIQLTTVVQNVDHIIITAFVTINFFMHIHVIIMMYMCSAHDL